MCLRQLGSRNTLSLKPNLHGSVSFNAAPCAMSEILVSSGLQGLQCSEHLMDML